VRAILAGTKTQTRRVLTPANSEMGCGPGWGEFWPELDFAQAAVDPGLGAGSYLKVPHPPSDTIHRLYPRWLAGEIVWVRERMTVIALGPSARTVTRIRVRYEADDVESDWIDWPERLRGKPELYKGLTRGGFREASRLGVLVTATRPERLWGITEADAIAEGAALAPNPDYDPDNPGTDPAETHRAGFVRLWDSLNARGGHPWSNNDWVWVREFKRIANRPQG
jgi:hypothetical protein